MVIVPRKVLEKLTNKGVSEADEKSKSSLLPFDFEDFLKSVDHESKVVPYLAKRNIEFVGTGSSRTAYMIPEGSCTDARNVPVCFKVAKNLAGIKQNETERSIMKKYGEDEACFAKIYKYDSKRNLCLETEIGAPLKQYDIKAYFSDWNGFVSKEAKQGGFIKNMKNIVAKLLKKNIGSIKEDLKIEDAKDIFNVLYVMKDFRNIGEDNVKYKETAKKYVDVAIACGKRYPKYSGMTSLIDILFNKGAEKELRIGEFSGEENFAMVYRNGNNDPVLIPIDYGVTEKVFDDFYGFNKKSDYFKDLGERK